MDFPLMIHVITAEKARTWLLEFVDPFGEMSDRLDGTGVCAGLFVFSGVVGVALVLDAPFGF
jgi:hypothetical protein